MRIAEASELFPLITKCAKINNNTNINNIATEVIVSVYSYYDSVDNIEDNKYLELFTLLKHVLISMGSSCYIAKKKCVLKFSCDLKKRQTRYYSIQAVVIFLPHARFL